MKFPVDKFTIDEVSTTQVQLCGNIGSIELLAPVGTVLQIDYRGPSGVATAITYVTLTVSAGFSELFLDTADYLAGYYDFVLTTLPAGVADVYVSYQGIS
jgi:hypothetical protein